MINEILKHNREFVANRGYESYVTDKFPAKRIAVVTCMDTRLVELLPAALGLRNGDVKMIKNAGGTITEPFDSAMRSVLVAVYELGVDTVMVIGHTGCGVQGMNGHHFIELMKKRGVDAEKIGLMEYCGIDLEKWLTGFEDSCGSVRDTVSLIRRHPLLPAGITVRGFMIDSTTGELTEVEDA